MRASKSYDPLNRLSQAISSSGDGSVLSYGFQYNDANQRTRVSMPDGSSWLYEYDELGQVVSGKRYWADGTPVAGQQFEYAFDDIGNRTATKAGGDSSGGNLRSASYSNDLLNLLTEREVPGAVDITGISHAQATNRVNGQAPNRYGEYFHLAITTNNGTGPVWLNVTNTAWLGGVTNSQTGHVYLAKSPEAYGYDEDGNLTSSTMLDSRRIFALFF